MKKISVLATLLLCFSLLLSGCTQTAAPSDDAAASEQSIAETNSLQTTAESDLQTEIKQTSANTISGNTSDMFTDRDTEVDYDASDCVPIQLNNSTSQCDSDAVQISNQTITITEEGTYLLSGTLTDGMIIIESADTDKIRLILDNVSITSKTSAAIYIKEADKVFITLAPDSVNTLNNAGNYTDIDDNNIDAVLFSKSDLTLNGSGTLTINADEGHGIVSKDDLVITSGNYQITANGKGLSGKDSIRIANGQFTITSGKDCIHAENADDTSLGFMYVAGGTFLLTSESDGMSALSYMQIEDGDFTIQAADDGMHSDAALTISGGNIDIIQSYEGIEGTSIIISGGEVNVTASDDGLNASGDAGQNPSIEISGGITSVSAEGDGIDSNGSLTISGGETYVTGPTNGGNASLDYGSEATITGGIFAAAGSSQMAQNFVSSSTQGSMMINVDQQSAGSSISLADENNQQIFSWQPDKNYSCVIISCPEITQGNSYTLTAGSSETSVTMDSLIYGSGNGMGNMGGMNGMGGKGDKGGMGGSNPGEMPAPDQPNGEMPEAPDAGSPDAIPEAPDVSDNSNDI